MLFHVVAEVMFAVFLTLLLADIPWTSGKYFTLKTTFFCFSVTVVGHIRVSYLSIGKCRILAEQSGV